MKYQEPNHSNFVLSAKKHATSAVSSAATWPILQKATLTKCWPSSAMWINFGMCARTRSGHPSFQVLSWSSKFWISLEPKEPDWEHPGLIDPKPVWPKRASQASLSGQLSRQLSRQLSCHVWSKGTKYIKEHAKALTQAVMRAKELPKSLTFSMILV